MNAARDVLAARARALARVPEAPPAKGDAIVVAAFRLGGDRYALETRFVLEVARLTTFTPLPGAPPFVKGITHLRGEVLALVDLRPLLGVAEEGLRDLTRVLVLGEDRPEMAVLSDSVEEVLEIRLKDLGVPPGARAGVAHTHLRGVRADGLMVLDGAALLEDRRLFVDQEEEKA
jgi:purine-binding chemotaxis protein CheW